MASLPDLDFLYSEDGSSSRTKRRRAEQEEEKRLARLLPTPTKCPSCGESVSIPEPVRDLDGYMEERLVRVLRGGDSHCKRALMSPANSRLLARVQDKP